MEKSIINTYMREKNLMRKIVKPRLGHLKIPSGKTIMPEQLNNRKQRRKIKRALAEEKKNELPAAEVARQADEDERAGQPPGGGRAPRRLDGRPGRTPRDARGTGAVGAGHAPHRFG